MLWNHSDLLRFRFQFWKILEKGSKPFRKILSYKERKSINVSTLNTVKTFVEIIVTGSQIVTYCVLVGENGNGIFMETDVKNFCINSDITFLGLGLINVLHFIPNHPVKCNSLCIANNEPLPVQACVL